MKKTDKKDRLSWIRAGAKALASGGWANVKVEPLARAMGVTKGSFYWHFENQRALLEAIVEQWELDETEAVIDRVDDGATTPADRLFLLFAVTDEGPLDTELAIRDLATRDERVQEVVRRVDARRLGYLRRNFRGLGLDPLEAEARSLLAYSLLIGDFFIAPAHGRYARRTVLEHATGLLLREP